MANNLNNSFLNDFEPSEFFLSQNYPNPFKDSTKIKYCVANRTRVLITVFNSENEEVEKLVAEIKDPGTYEVEFNTSIEVDGQIKKLPDGYYYYRMTADEFISEKKWFCINKLLRSNTMKSLLQTLFFFLLLTPICFARNVYIVRNIDQLISVGTEITDSTILVKRIDHIAAYYNSIEEVDSMLNLFNEVLRLPQWFSPAIRDVVSPANSKFYNTGVYLGNVFLEFITFNVDTPNTLPRTYLPYFNAFAFANEITNTAAILNARSIPRSQVFHYLFREPDQSILTLFSNITLSNFYNNELLVFFCQYHPELFDCESFDFGNLPTITNPDSQHIYYSNLVDSINGGPLTLSKVENIILTSNNFESYRQKFSTLFFPSEEEEQGKWSPPSGPSLILQSSQTAIKLTTINIAVGSLHTAKEFLISKGLGFQEGTDYIKLELSTNVGADIILTNIVTSIEDQLTYAPNDFVLEQNFPNPFNPSTMINYRLPVSSEVTIKVFDVLGNEIVTIVNEYKPAGRYEVEFSIYSDEGRNLSSGVYLYQLRAGEFMKTRKMILIK